MHKYLQCSNYIMKMLSFDLCETSNFKRFFENCKSNFYNIWNFPNVIDTINRKYICLNFSYIYKMLRNLNFTHIQDWYILAKLISLIDLNNLFPQFTIFIGIYCSIINLFIFFYYIFTIYFIPFFYFIGVDEFSQNGERYCMRLVSC